MAHKYANLSAVIYGITICHYECTMLLQLYIFESVYTDFYANNNMI